MVDPSWSLDRLLQDYRPHESWCRWFAEAFSHAIESAQPEERLDGWKAAATIFGDMHVPVFCLFVCYHGRSLVPPQSTAFLSHIDRCLWELGLATPDSPDTLGAVPSRDIGKPETFHGDAEAGAAWLATQLLPFGGNVERAALFAMRLTAAHFGLLSGPAEPSISQVLDESLWERVYSI